MSFDLLQIMESADFATRLSGSDIHVVKSELIQMLCRLIT